MSDLYLSRFLNTNRPPLEHESVLEIPTDILGQELSTSILASLKVDSNDAYVCSISARLWEETLENYPCLPYLLLRVADMRFALQSRFTALKLYKEARQELVYRGFYDSSFPLLDEYLIGGAVTCGEDALSILRDTYETYKEVFELWEQGSLHLTVDLLNHFHRKLMKTSRVLSVRTRTPSEIDLSYINVGTNRQHTKTNVIAGSINSIVQFCPFDEVEKELEFFCQKFNDLMHTPDIHPFAVAAWISHAFIEVHPFEDGNGRLSRILSAIPLLNAGLPFCIPAHSKQMYILELNNLRVKRNEYCFRKLGFAFYLLTALSLGYLKDLMEVYPPNNTNNDKESEAFEKIATSRGVEQGYANDIVT